MTTYALEVRNLVKAFGGLKVTQAVNLAVAPGERHLVIGPNGAGKTTLRCPNLPTRRRPNRWRMD